MERLTKRNECGDAYYPECYERCYGEGSSEKCNDCDYDEKICDTLADYEDTGLTLPEIMELKDRDMPKKIELNAGIPTCPVCGRRIVKCYDFCPDCGQRLEQQGGMTMREMLFRAKQRDNGEWAEGFYSQLPKPSLGAMIITNGDLCAEDVSDYIIANKSKQHSNFSNSYPFEVVECEYYEINPETLCQYTGLTDKNGNRIWENDIISINTYDYNEPQEDFFGKVVYAEGWGCWCIQQPGEEKPIPLCECEGSYLTERVVEGNIFDTPELLKGE